MEFIFLLIQLRGGNNNHLPKKIIKEKWLTFLKSKNNNIKNNISSTDSKNNDVDNKNIIFVSQHLSSSSPSIITSTNPSLCFKVSPNPKKTKITQNKYDDIFHHHHIFDTIKYYYYSLFIPTQTNQPWLVIVATYIKGCDDDEEEEELKQQQQQQQQSDHVYKGKDSSPLPHSQLLTTKVIKVEKGFYNKPHSEQHTAYPFTSITVGGLTDEDKATNNNKEYLQVVYRIQTINPTTDTGFRNVRGRYDGMQGFRFELNSNPNGYNIKPFETRTHKYDYSATAEPLSDPEEERKRIKAQRSFRLRYEGNQQKRAKAFVNLTLICRRKEEEEGKLVTAHRVKTAKCDSGLVSHVINIGESVRCNYNCTEPQQQPQQQLQQRKTKYVQTDIDDDDDDEDNPTPSLEQRRRVKTLRSIKWRENDFKQRNTPTTFKVFFQFDTSVKTAVPVPTLNKPAAAPPAAEKKLPTPTAAAAPPAAAAATKTVSTGAPETTSSLAAAPAATTASASPSASISAAEKKQPAPVATTTTTPAAAAEKKQQPTPAVATTTTAAAAAAPVAATKTVSTATTTTATRAPIQIQTGSSLAAAQKVIGAIAPTPKSEAKLATFVTIKPDDNQVIVKPDQRIDTNIYMIVWSTPNNNRPQAA